MHNFKICDFLVSDIILVDYVFPIIHSPILKGNSTSFLPCDVTGGVSYWRVYFPASLTYGLIMWLALTDGGGYDVVHLQAETLRATAQFCHLSSSFSCPGEWPFPEGSFSCFILDSEMKRHRAAEEQLTSS